MNRFIHRVKASALSVARQMAVDALAKDRDKMAAEVVVANTVATRLQSACNEENEKQANLLRQRQTRSL